MPLSDRQVKAFLDASPDAMVITNARGAMIFVNEQAEALFGYAYEELIGQPVEMLLPERFRARHSRHRQTYGAAPRKRPMGVGVDLYGLRKDGTEFPAEVALSPVRTEQELFVCGVVRDVTERKTIERQLIEAREAAERANWSKSAFLAAASHDLRQPLQTLRLVTGVLANATPSGSPAAEAVTIQSEALRGMSDLLNSLLDISKLEAGVIKPDIADCSVRPILARLRREFADQARAKSLELIVEECDDVVRTDATLFEHVIQNLLVNAIRYTREGWVRLRCLASSAGVRVEVLDTGIGIPLEERELIFEEFYQAPRAAGQLREGLGLGLSIVRRLADLLGLTLEVDSTPGKGSCFAVIAPRGAAAGRVAAPTPAPPAHAPATGGRILIVDDDAAVASATALLLKAMGYEAAVALSAGQAEARLRESGQSPGLIITDYHLEGSSAAATGHTREQRATGVQAIQRLRAAAGRTIPAILVSGDTSSAMAGIVQAVEACHLMSKPVETDALLTLIAQLLSGRER